VRIIKALITPLADIFNDFFDMGDLARSRKVSSFIRMFRPYILQISLILGSISSVIIWYFLEKYLVKTDKYTKGEWEKLEQTKKNKYFKIKEVRKRFEFEEFEYRNKIINNPDYELVEVKEVKDYV